MDLYPSRRRSSLSKAIGKQPEEEIGVQEKRYRLFGAMRITEILVYFMVIIPVFLVIVVIFGQDSSDQGNGFANAARIIQIKPEPNVTSSDDSTTMQRDQKQNDLSLLGGLLVSGFKKESCLSRYQSYLYRKASPHKPSLHLLSKLRAYEELHKRCGPGTRPYTNAERLLKPKQTGDDSESQGCKYVVWMEFSGLGNRIISIASAFLYAMLTDRVLLVEGGEQLEDLFCEPFIDTTWLLPKDFTLTHQFNGFGQDSAQCHGDMVKRKLINGSSVSSLSHLYLHLAHDYNDHDKMFFCEEDQSLLKNVPWLIMRTNNFFAPSLFLIPSFQEELGSMFPDKGTVFHHLGRYLFHPSNHVWGLITRYYQAYLAKADERIGLQIRVFDEKSGVSPQVTKQIISCVENAELLPKLSKPGEKQKPLEDQEEDFKLKAVLVTSLTTGYFEILKTMYWENPSVTRDVVAIHQPSHEGHQQTEKLMHNRKAWAEMYLLSLTDKLVISAWSTFGYVAQGLGGLRAWILYKQENQTALNSPCGRAMSSDPCFHAPPYYDCKAKQGTDTGNVVPHVRHCEDISWGLKLVDNS